MSTPLAILERARVEPVADEILTDGFDLDRLARFVFPPGLESV